MTESARVPAWSVTHIQSGKAVAYGDSHAEALNLAKRIRHVCDWTDAAPHFTAAALDDALGDLQHRAAYKWGASSIEPGAGAKPAP